MEAATDFWKKCSTCKKPIAYGAKYYVCSVSSCNGQRTGYVFCNMVCFEAHVPGARHRDAGAISHVAPASAAAAQGTSTSASGGEPAARAPARIIARPSAAPTMGTSPTGASARIPKEVLVIASRLKDYVQARGDMNTSASVMDVLSEYLRILCDRGMENARADGRKTLMDRDFEFLKK
jgi:histone H3/H4